MSNSVSEKRFFGHPLALSTLFHIELWERFSFYGMQGILLIYLYYTVDKGGLGIDQSLAGGIVGAYGGSVYLSTIFGAWLADRVWGSEKTLLFSGMVVMLGHLALAFLPGVYGLLAGLVLVALGSGGVKATASAMVGSLYETPDMKPLRDAGFSIFYIAINIGGFLGPLLTGVLQEQYGFHYGFGVAAIGMAFGLWRYLSGRSKLPASTVPNPLKPNQGKVALAVVALGVAALLGVIKAGWLNLQNFSQVLLYVVIAAVVVYFVRLLTSAKVAAQNKRYIMAYIPLFLTICLFWAVWFQVYTVATVYFDEMMDRTIAGFTIPVSWKDSLQSMWVILFSGLLATMWTKMGDKQPKTPLKFAIAMLFVGVSYLGFVPFVSAGTAMPLWIFALVILGITIGELCLSPISLSLATKIAPPNFKAQMVALNFLALSIGFTLGGVLFKNYYQAETIIEFCQLLCTIGVANGLILLLFVPILNKLLKGAD
ncbi:oligopeptide:H+ symporter [Moraxella sp. ZJ142]|uniref:oligopeptide:H+ symporter n=1 Tax=Moraxella marmotae TaxID=3344520 RepID=UPI0035D47A19